MKEYDVVVVGGGSAGLCAAITAGRMGAKTLLVERYGMVGGMATVGMTYHWDPIKMLGVRGIALEFYEAMKARGDFLEFPFEQVNPMTTMWEGGASFHPEHFLSYALEELKKAGVELRLYTLVTGVKRDNGRIVNLAAYQNDWLEIAGKIFIDATGDGNLVYLSGAPYEIASKEELQSSTLMVKIGGVDLEKMFTYLEENPQELGVHPRLGKMIRDPRRTATIIGFRDCIRRARENGDLSFSLPEHGIGFDRLARDGEFRLNCTHTANLDCTEGNSMTEAYLSERGKTEELMRFLNRYIPGCERAYLMQTAVQVGVRESRRLVGDYQLTEEDLAQARRFDDAVLEAQWAHCDVHSPDGKEWSFKMYPGPYQIPYRCFLPKGVENLYGAGRCISCGRAAFASVRIQMITMTMGQAVGAAAAMAAVTPAGRTRDVDVKRLQETLRGMDYRI